MYGIFFHFVQLQGKPQSLATIKIVVSHGPIAMSFCMDLKISTLFFF